MPAVGRQDSGSASRSSRKAGSTGRKRAHDGRSRHGRHSRSAGRRTGGRWRRSACGWSWTSWCPWSRPWPQPWPWRRGQPLLRGDESKAGRVRPGTRTGAGPAGALARGWVWYADALLDGGAMASEEARSVPGAADVISGKPSALSGSRVAGPHGRLHAARAAQQEPQDWEAPGEGAAPQAAGSERCADDALLSRARQRGGLLLHPSRHEDAHLTLCPVAAPAAALPGSAKRGGSKTAAAGASKRQARQLAAKQQRDAKRAEVVQAKRSSCVTPKVRAIRGRAHSEARQQASTSKAQFEAALRLLRWPGLRSKLKCDSTRSVGWAVGGLYEVASANNLPTHSRPPHNAAAL